MVWQSIVVILLGCNLAGNTLTSAIHFPNSVSRRSSGITEGEELLRALEFLETYEGARQPEPLDNNYLLFGNEYDDVVPYDPSFSQSNFLNGNGLPPLSLDDFYPIEEETNDPYDLTVNYPYDMINNMVVDQTGSNNRKLTIGERVEHNAEFNHLMDRLIEDAVIEEVLREDAAEAAETLEEDLEDGEVELSSYDSEADIDYGAASDDYASIGSSYAVEDDYSEQGDSSYLDDSEEEYNEDEEVDKDLMESVILQLTGSQMQDKLLENDDIGLFDDTDDDLDFNTEEEINSFISKIVTELMEGSEDLADKLIDEIDEEKEMLDEEEAMLEEDEEEDEEEEEYETKSYEDDVIFDDGWDFPIAEDDNNDFMLEDASCPALDFILDDCMVVDDFPGLGDDGYKEGFGESCNRHQLCYFCSETFEVPVELCDETYKVELMSICNDDPECDFRAKYFWLSAIASRSPSDVILPLCREPCVVSYLLDF